MNQFTPSRRISYIALIVIALAAVAVAYRRLQGDDTVALALGLATILSGIVVVVLFYVEWQAQYRGILRSSARYGRIARRGRIAAIVGAVLVVVSFVWLGAAVTLFDASPNSNWFFQIWLALFLIGCAFLFFPVVLKWAITLGFVRSGDDDETHSR